MAKITQKKKEISADFVYIENQYQNNTFDIEIELSDNTFDGYTVMASVGNPNYSNNFYTLPIINGFISLPYYTTDKLGTLTVSLFGFKGNDVMTTNRISFTVEASNPTNINKVPEYQDWNAVMQEYVNAMIAQTKDEITPSIDPTNNHWLIGGVDTGVSATGDFQEEIDKVIEYLEIDHLDITVSPSAFTEQTGEDIEVVNYPFKGQVPIEGVMSTDVCELWADQATADLGILSLEADTYDGGVYIWTNELPEVDLKFRRIIQRKEKIYGK